MPRHGAALAIAALLIPMTAGVALRVVALDLRPMHGDEANQAVKTAHLLERGAYRYDPHEHHGPTLYYAALPILRMTGAHRLEDMIEPALRATPLVFGLLALLAYAPLARHLGAPAAILALGFASLSHGIVYYTRYYIQESLLACFAMLLVVFALEYAARPRLAAAIAAGAAIGLMHATKETCIVFIAALAAAGLAAALWARIAEGRWPAAPPGARWLHGAALAAIAAFVSIAWYSSFFTYPQGPIDSIATYLTYLGRAEGAGSAALHDKPWHYYLGVLLHVQREAGPRWTEAPLLLFGLLGLAVSLAPQRDPAAAQRALAWRAVSLYAFALLAAFSLIPYKTPWNLLGPLYALAIPAGIGAAWLIAPARRPMLRAAAALLIAAAMAHQARIAYLGNFVYAADARNPYVYAHTSTALLRLIAQIERLAAVAHEGRALHIDVVRPGGDYWPLPWYLRHCTRVGYWTAMPPATDAAIIITAPELEAEWSARLGDRYVAGMHGLRPGALLLVYVRHELWDAMIAAPR